MLDRKENQRRAKDEKERKARAEVDSSAATGATTTIAASELKPVEELAPVDQSVPTNAEYQYYAPSSTQASGIWAEAPAAAATTAFDGYDYSAPANVYDYNGHNYTDYDYSGYMDYATGTAAPSAVAECSTLYSADPLVDSGDYFYAPDGNASAWQNYDYDTSAYNASSDAYYNDDGYSYANGEAGAGGELIAPSYISPPQAADGYYGDATGYYQPDGQWSDSAGYYGGYQEQQQSYSTTAQGYDGYGYDAGAAVPTQSTNGYIDHHSQSQYFAMDGGSGVDQAYEYTTPSTAVAAESALAAWEEVFDPQTSQVYYVNRITQETAWELPSFY